MESTKIASRELVEFESHEQGATKVSMKNYQPEMAKALHAMNLSTGSLRTLHQGRTSHGEARRERAARRYSKESERETCPSPGSGLSVSFRGFAWDPNQTLHAIPSVESLPTITELSALAVELLHVRRLQVFSDSLLCAGPARPPHRPLPGFIDSRMRNLRLMLGFLNGNIS